ncbi:hypothetical protein GCM10027426_25560 [Microbacterium lacusdiani]
MPRKEQDVVIGESDEAERIVVSHWAASPADASWGALVSREEPGYDILPRIRILRLRTLELFRGAERSEGIGQPVADRPRRSRIAIRKCSGHIRVLRLNDPFIPPRAAHPTAARGPEDP